MADQQSWIEVGTVETSLSLVVWLTDGFTGGKPVGNPTVTVDGVEADARNPSGHYLFFDLQSDEVEVVVDGTDRYFTESMEIDLSNPDDWAGADRESDGGAEDAEPADSGPAMSAAGGPSATTPAGGSPSAPGGDAPEESEEQEAVPRYDELLTVEVTPTPAYEFPSWVTLVRGRLTDSDGHPVVGATVSATEFDHQTSTDARGEYVYYVTALTADELTMTFESTHGTESKTVTVAEGSSTVLNHAYS